MSRYVPRLLFAAVVMALGLQTAAPAHGTGREAKVDPYLRLQLDGWDDELGGRLAASGDPDHIDVIVQAHRDPTGQIEALGGTVRSFIGGGVLVTARMPKDRVGHLAASPLVRSLEASKPLRQMRSGEPQDVSSSLAPPLDVSVDEARVRRAWTLKDAQGRSIKGAGVIVGIVDTGIDWTHPDFTKPTGASRVLALWDQTLKGDGPAGTSFGYGVECRNNFTPGGCLSTDSDGHGTHVASIAAGHGSPTSQPKYVGVAPEADVIAVKLGSIDRSANGIDAWTYIVNQARALGRPVVINNSWGHDFGAKDGSDPMEGAIDLLAGPGVAFVSAAGNSGDRMMHAVGTLVEGASATLAFALPANSTRRLTAMTLWYSGSDDFELSVETPAGQVLPSVKKGERVRSMSEDGIEVAVDATRAPYELNGLNAVIAVARRDSGVTGTWRVRLLAKTVKGTGRFDAWLPYQYRGGEEFLSQHKSLDMSLGEPSTARRTITVANYLSNRCFTSVIGQLLCWQHQALNTGDLIPNSSVGPTRDGRQKPEIAAPGAFIAAALSKDAPEARPLDPDRLLVVADGRHIMQWGTSMAAPHVTGTVALMLQKHPKLTPEQVKAALLTSARKDSFTGPITWSPAWGVGKLDAFAAVNATPAYVAPLAAPAAVTPAHQASLPGLGNELTWTNPPGATQYHLQVTPANNDGPGLNVIRDAATSQAIPAPVVGVGPYIMLPGMTYTWRVRASAATTAIGEDDSSWSPWSEPRTFRTAVRTSAGITALSHQGGVLSPITPQTLRWQNTDADVFYYELQLSSDPTFETDPARATAAVYTNLVHGGAATPTNSWQTPVLQHEATYHWRLRPRIQGDGQPVPWSQTYTFRTD